MGPLYRAARVRTAGKYTRQLFFLLWHETYPGSTQAEELPRLTLKGQKRWPCPLSFQRAMLSYKLFRQNSLHPAQQWCENAKRPSLRIDSRDDTSVWALLQPSSSWEKTGAGGKVATASRGPRHLASSCPPWEPWDPWESRLVMKISYFSITKCDCNSMCKILRFKWTESSWQEKAGVFQLNQIFSN